METAEYSYQDFTRIPDLAHRLMGFYMLKSPKKPSTKILMFIYRWICNCLHALSICCMVFRIIERTTINTLPILTRYGCLVTYALNSDIKFATSQQRESIQRLSNKLSALYPQTRESRIAHQIKKFYWPRPLLLIILIYFLSSAMVVVGPFIQSVVLYLYNTEEKFLYLHGYPIFIFDPECHSVWRYVGIYIIEYFHSVHSVSSNMATDLWMICFQMQICLHLNYLIRSLQNYEPHRNHDKEDREFLARLIDKHNILINLQAEINRIFGGSMLFSLLTSAVVLCFVSLYVVVQGLNMEGVSMLMFTCTSTLQLYLVCYYGQLVSTLSEDIIHAAYGHNWLEASMSYKKSLIMIIRRAQQPLELSAMGYLSVSHDTFRRLMTMALRVFILLRQMI